MSDSSPIESSSDSYSLFKQRDFMLYMVARLFANLGVQMQTVAVGWAVYSRTSQPLDLGLVGLSQFAPFVLLILPAGHFADHHDRRRIVISCLALHAICALILGLLMLRDMSIVWPVFAAMVLLGTARAFIMPASQALLPNMVPREHFGRAVAFNSSVYQVTTVVGPALGGVLLIAGNLTVFIIVLSCMIIATASAIAVRTSPVVAKEKATSGDSEPDIKSLLSGLSFVRSRPAVLGAISLDLFAVLFGGSVALLPVYARDILHVGPSGLGLLRSAPGVGAVVCAIWLTAKPIIKHVGPWMFGSVALFGLSTIVFGASTNFTVSLFALVVLGASDMVSVFVRGYLVQVMTPDHIRGRVSAVSSVFIGASNELGEFESGVTAAWLGTIRSVVMGGAATIGITMLWTKLFPEIRNMNQFPEAER